MIIDIHTHIYNRKKLDAYNKATNGAVSKIIALPWYNDQVPGWLTVDELLKFTEKEPQMYALGSIDMDRGIFGQLRKHEQLFKEKKILGIKLYPGYQHFYPHTADVVKIARLCEKYNKPLVFHSGDFYDERSVAVLKYSHPKYIDELADKCPNTKIVISHFGFPYILETAVIVSKNENVFTDISGTIDDCGKNDKDIEVLTKQYVQDLKQALNYYPDIKGSVMFGTDFCDDDLPLNQTVAYMQVIKKIFKPAEQENAFFRLAKKLYFDAE